MPAATAPAAALVPTSSTPSAAVVPAARAALIEDAEAALKKAKKGRREEAVDGVLCSTFQGVEAGGALEAVKSLCDPLDDSSLISARNGVYYAETGIKLHTNGKPPPDTLWPDEQPPDGHMVLVPGFKNQGAQTTLRRQWWLRVAVALANCIRKGQRMAMRRCMIKSGANQDTFALFMCVPALPRAHNHSLASPELTC